MAKVVRISVTERPKQEDHLAQVKRYCKACDAGYDNSLPRIIRCMTCTVLNGTLPPTRYKRRYEKS